MARQVAEFEQYATENLDYTIDWQDRLGSDTIDTVTWSGTNGISITSPSNTTTTTKAKISGGIAGETYRVTCDITTVAGLTMREVLEFFIARTQLPGG